MGGVAANRTGPCQAVLVTRDSGTSTLHHDQHPPPRVRAGEAILSVRELSAGYADTLAFEAVSFDVAAGNLVALIGPNGSGKSTLIKTLMGLLQPWSGEFSLWGRDPAVVRERIGYMPQAESVD